jgi:hypothetical protein
VDSTVEYCTEFSETLAARGFADTLVLGRERADVAFHDRRLQIIDYLTENELTSAQALAGALDLGNLSILRYH